MIENLRVSNAERDKTMLRVSVSLLFLYINDVELVANVRVSVG